MKKNFTIFAAGTTQKHNSMQYNKLVSETRTTKSEKITLDNLRHIMEDLCGYKFVGHGNRSRKYAEKRQILAFIAHRHHIPTTHIAAYIGYNSHKSAVHAIDLIESLLKYDRDIRESVRIIDSELEFRSQFGFLSQNSWEC